MQCNYITEFDWKVVVHCSSSSPNNCIIIIEAMQVHSVAIQSVFLNPSYLQSPSSFIIGLLCDKDVEEVVAEEGALFN